MCSALEGHAKVTTKLRLAIKCSSHAFSPDVRRLELGLIVSSSLVDLMMQADGVANCWGQLMMYLPVFGYCIVDVLAPSLLASGWCSSVLIALMRNTPSTSSVAAEKARRAGKKPAITHTRAHTRLSKCLHLRASFSARATRLLSEFTPGMFISLWYLLSSQLYAISITTRDLAEF